MERRKMEMPKGREEGTTGAWVPRREMRRFSRWMLREK